MTDRNIIFPTSVSGIGYNPIHDYLIDANIEKKGNNNAYLFKGYVMSRIKYYIWVEGNNSTSYTSYFKEIYIIDYVSDWKLTDSPDVFVQCIALRAKEIQNITVHWRTFVKNKFSNIIVLGFDDLIDYEMFCFYFQPKLSLQHPDVSCAVIDHTMS